MEAVLLANLDHQEYMLPVEPQDYEDSAGFIKGAGTPPSDLSQYGIEEEDDHAQ